MRMKRGILVAIEGIDGSGKSTLAKNLSSMLSQTNHSVVTTKEPGGCDLGISLREILQTQTVPITPHAEFLMFAADRAQHITDIIKPALEQGSIVISDRMTDSSLVYQGYGRGLDIDMIQHINDWVMQGIKADITLYVSIDPETAFARIMKRKNLTAFEKQGSSFAHRLVNGFETIYKNRADVVTLSATDTPEHLTNLAYQSVEQWLKQKQN